MKYGTLPIVNMTGGLKDTVVDLENKEGTGFVLSPLNPENIVKAAERAKEFYKDKESLTEARKRAMKVDSSWKKSAEEYMEVYSSLL